MPPRMPGLSGSRFKRVSANLLSFPNKQAGFMLGGFFKAVLSYPNPIFLGPENEAKQSVSWLLKPKKGMPLVFLKGLRGAGEGQPHQAGLCFAVSLGGREKIRHGILKRNLTTNV